MYGRSCLALALVLALAALAPARAGAHELWIERAPAGFVLRYGHGGALLPIDARRVKAVRCVSGGQIREAAASPAPGGMELSIPGGCGAVAATLDGGAWSLTPDGEVNRPRAEVPQAVRSWVSRQYAKWVDARGDAGVVLGDELELAPAGDLSRARQGDKVTLRVLSRGQPVRDAVVSIDHRPIGETDSRGEVRLRLRAATLEVVSASVRRKAPTADGDELVLEATLSFEVAR